MNKIPYPLFEGFKKRKMITHIDPFFNNHTTYHSQMAKMFLKFELSLDFY